MTTPAADPLDRVATTRARLAFGLTAAMTAIYVVFVLLVAFAKPWLGRVVVPGLSLGILFGALVIVCAWLLIVVYTWWANNVYDAVITRARQTGPRA